MPTAARSGSCWPTTAPPTAASRRRPGAPGFGWSAPAATSATGARRTSGVRALDPAIDWVVITNPDIVFAPQAIDRLLECADRHPASGAFGPLITTPDGVVYPSARQPAVDLRRRRARGVRLVVADQPVDPPVPAGRAGAGRAGGRLAVRFVPAGPPPGLRAGRRVRSGVLHVLRGRRPRRPAGPGGLVEHLLPDGAGRRTRAGTPPSGSRRRWRRRTTAAPTGTWPPGTRPGGRRRCAGRCKAGLGARALLARRLHKVAAGAELPERHADQLPPRGSSR